jgi:2-oxoglutarate dehydrogenase E2 component (dihydrolipoamide succinyltransferase)
MPALGESVTEGTVTRWLKNVGDTVAVDEPLVEISTDKVDTEIPSPFGGVLLQILVPEDDVAEVGAVLAVLGDPGETPPSMAPVPPAAAAPVAAPAVVPAPVAPVAASIPPPPPPPPAPVAPVAMPAPVGASIPPPPPPPPAPVAAPVAAAAAAPVAAPASAPAPAPLAAMPTPTAEPIPTPAPRVAPADLGAGYVSPLVRKLAQDIGVDLAGVKGTGVGGRIRREDVLAAKPVPAPATPAAAPASSDMPKLRAYSAGQLTSVAEVDLSYIVRVIDHLGERFLSREGIELTVTPFMVRAVAKTLQQYPQFNAAISGGEVTYFREENIGVTVDTASGPAVPVLNQAGTLGLTGLARAIAQVTARAQTGALLPDDLLGGTFTLTNPGGPDVMLNFPVIQAPQVAILSVGAVTKRPVVTDDAIAVRSMSYLALSYDSRLIDGTDAGKFLSAVKQRLESPGAESDLAL